MMVDSSVGRVIGLDSFIPKLACRLSLFQLRRQSARCLKIRHTLARRPEPGRIVAIPAFTAGTTDTNAI
jgi:hypothetical protein